MHYKMGEAVCLKRVDDVVVGGYSYIAGMVRLVAGDKNENVLIVQRCPSQAVEGTRLMIVLPGDIPDEVKKHPSIAVYLSNNTGRVATTAEASGLIRGSISSYWHPSLVSMQPMLDSATF